MKIYTIKNKVNKEPIRILGFRGWQHFAGKLIDGLLFRAKNNKALSEDAQVEELSQEGVENTSTKVENEILNDQE